eukprot:5893512-Alexandrium_andersonii.AAC.1
MSAFARSAPARERMWTLQLWRHRGSRHADACFALIRGRRPLAPALGLDHARELPYSAGVQGVFWEAARASP